MIPKILFAGAAAVILADAVMILLACRDRSCQRCCRRWAIFTRQQMRVCRSCKREIDRQFAMAALRPKWPRT